MRKCALIPKGFLDLGNDGLPIHHAVGHHVDRLDLLVGQQALDARQLKADLRAK